MWRVLQNMAHHSCAEIQVEQTRKDEMKPTFSKSCLGPLCIASRVSHQKEGRRNPSMQPHHPIPAVLPHSPLETGCQQARVGISPKPPPHFIQALFRGRLHISWFMPSTSSPASFLTLQWCCPAQANPSGSCTDPSGCSTHPMPFPRIIPPLFHGSLPPLHAHVSACPRPSSSVWKLE